jgi:hypothetical protein
MFSRSNEFAPRKQSIAQKRRRYFMISTEPQFPERSLHVLALSGGGYRGLYTATILAELEAAMGGPIASKFDLICGTSIGGILALGIAKEISAQKLKSFIEIEGRDIFGRRGFLRSMLGFRWLAKHDSKNLRKALESRFADDVIGCLKHRVLIPTVNYSTGRGQIFKTPHHRSFEMDYKMTMVDVALATSAAPVFFPLARNERGVFADGGLLSNAPGFFGLHEIKTFIDSKARVRVLSIGTMTSGATIRGNSSLDRGYLKWRGGLFDLIISAQESSVDYILRQLLGHDYYHIDDKLTPDQSRDVGLDVVSAAATNTLRDRGIHAAQRALGDPLFEPFRSHKAAPAIFYHGPNKNSS